MKPKKKEKMESPRLSGAAEKKAQPECGSPDWICEDPFRAVQMLVLIMFAILSAPMLYLYYVWDAHVTFAAVGPVVILSAIYSATHFRTLMRLKRAVQSMAAVADKVDRNLRKTRVRVK